MLKRKTLKIVAATVLCCNLIGSSTALASNYKVQAGDTLSSIATKFNMTVSQIKSANNMTSDSIWSGQNLYIPDGGTTHKVVAGDTLSTLANRYKVTVSDIKRANNLSNDTIHVGQSLWIPLTKSTPTSSRSNGQRYQATAEEVELLAKAIYGEARGESLTGQIAVGAVILNRVESEDFPNTIKGVIYEPYAFTCVQDGQFYLKPDPKAYEAAREALKGIDPTKGSTYYWNPKTATSEWIWSRAVVTKIGNHIFGY